MSPRNLTLLLALALLAPTALALDLPAITDVGGASRAIVGFHELPALKVGDRYQDEEIVAVNEGLGYLVLATRDLDRLRIRATLDVNVRYVEVDDPDFGRAFYVPNDSLYNNAGHYGTKKIGAETAWGRTLGSTSVKVAIIDSGMLKTHEEFAGSGRVLQGYDFVSNDNDPNDNCGHGTHVAGTIGATINNAKGIAGMAQATLLPIRGLSATLVLCSGSTNGLANALQYAGDQGAHLSSNSWGGGSSSAVTDAINYAHARGVTHVAAAGNDGSCTNCVGEPWKSNAAKVIIVSSTDSNDGLSSFSSQGPQVDVSAPGSSIISSYNGGTSSYSTLSGTSMATPHVTGLAALIKTLNPTWGYTQIDNQLKTTAKDLGAAGKDDKFGYGRIDAAAATGGAAPPANIPPTAAFTTSANLLAVIVNGASSSDPDGTIVSYSWNWGDGSAASTGVSKTHTYPATGTYTITLTVTDNSGATGTATNIVSVDDGSDPDPGALTLQNGVAKSDSLAGAGNEKFYKIQVPAGKSSLSVVLDGPSCGLLGCSTDLDLYVRKGARPTDANYDCRPFQSSNDESCSLANPGADWWFIRVKVYSGSASAAYTITATYS